MEEARTDYSVHGRRDLSDLHPDVSSSLHIAFRDYAQRKDRDMETDLVTEIQQTHGQTPKNDREMKP